MELKPVGGGAEHGGEPHRRGGGGVHGSISAVRGPPPLRRLRARRAAIRGVPDGVQLPLLRPPVRIRAERGSERHRAFEDGSANLWQSSWWESLPGLLFSPARGLVWFSPVLLLGLVSVVAVWRNQRLRALIPLQLGTVLAGKWFDWWGGLTWGYRPVCDAAPFLA